MGRDKAWLPHPESGRPLVEAALDALRAAGADPLLISCQDPGPFADLDAGAVPDLRPGGLGPLAGLEALLAASPHEWLLLVACDMPRLDPALLARLVDRAVTGGHDAVVPEVAGRLQPLHAVYHRRSLPAVRAALDADRRGLTRLVASLDLDRVALPDGPSFENANTPEELG